MGADATHYYAWGRQYFGGQRKGHKCRVVGRAPRMNSVLVEWADGTRDLVSRNAIRRVRDLPAHGERKD